jgi:hypothetical protein
MTRDEVTKLIAEAVTAAMKPLQDEIKASQTRIEAAQAKLTSLNEKRTAPQPERKTLPASISALLQGGGVAIDDATMLSLRRPS